LLSDLIHKNYIITAGHCFLDDEYGYLYKKGEELFLTRTPSKEECDKIIKENNFV
jgi:V8-like Glu-specific endopeptidase